MRSRSKSFPFLLAAYLGLPLPFLCGVAMLFGLALAGCEDGMSTGEARTIKYSGGEYNRGYRDGMREAKDSWMDDHAGWAWLWIMDKEYGQGYDRGWKDGRASIDLERKQKTSDDRADRDALSNEVK